MSIIQKIQIRRDAATNWTSNNPTLASGEFGFETDTGKLKVGDGSTAWTSLAYFAGLTDIVQDTTPQLGGDLDAQANHIGFTQQTVTYDSGTTTCDWGNGNKAIMAFGAGNITTFAFTNPPKPSNLLLKIVQDGVGGRTVTGWDADIKWVGGTAPTLSTGANAIDILSFYFDGTNYFGTASLNFS